MISHSSSSTLNVAPKVDSKTLYQYHCTTACEYLQDCVNLPEPCHHKKDRIRKALLSTELLP